jgi:hypothetical protein
VPAQKSPSEMRLWTDIASLDHFRRLASRAPRFADPAVTTSDEAIALFAKLIVDGISDGSDEERFLDLARTFIGKGRSGTVYNALDEFAEVFGLNFANAKAYLEWKGVIQKTRKPRTTS